jgi:alpha-mannosidase
MPSGELLVRHLLYGRGYLKKLLGVDPSPMLFLPDSFGFPPSLPKILNAFGIKYFATAKLTWNDTNGPLFTCFNGNVWMGVK